jgi:hypothetical protein
MWTMEHMEIMKRSFRVWTVEHMETVEKSLPA